jgi:mono/diheme cytochrome c family protein
MSACVLALATAACAGHAEQTASTTTSARADAKAATAATPSAIGNGDVGRGRQIYGEQCAQCHGATGTEGHIGPSLANEKARKTYAKTVSWIQDPTEPMPKLYPSPLTQQDVEDVASFVQTL